MGSVTSTSHARVNSGSHTGPKNKRDGQKWQCGIGILVVPNPSKVVKGVRFSYTARYGR